MKIKIQNPLWYGMLILLAIFSIIAMVTSCNTAYMKSELYPGQRIYLASDSAHRYVRDNIVNKSSFSVETRFFADIQVFDNPEKTGTPLNHVRKSMYGSNGVATVIPQEKGYLITAKHVVDISEAKSLLAEKTADTEKAQPGKFFTSKLITEYTLVGADEKKFLAIVVVLDKENDIGLIRTKDKNFNAPGVPLSTATDLTDKSCFAIGDPLGIHDVILDCRIANGKLENDDDLGRVMYMVAPIVPGNSGGAVIDTLDLKMLGVVSATMINKDPSSLTGYSLFIPNTVIEKFLEKNLPKKQ